VPESAIPDLKSADPVSEVPVSAAPDDAPKKDEKDTQGKMISFTELFKYQPVWDKTLIWLGVALSIVGGISAPLMAVVFGELIDIFDPK
jgi:hypothetical protein